MITFAQWQTTWQALNAPRTDALQPIYRTLMDRYRESHRHYHTQQHLAECLERFAELRHLADNPAEIALALWFHDAIYEPTRQDNEQRSAEWAAATMKTAKLDDKVCDRIITLVMATCHQHTPTNNDEKILLDCDLAILGASSNRFAEYGHQIRAEYAFVPNNIFKTKRREILQQFLDRPSIFNTPEFLDRYEAQARTNLTHAIQQLT